MKQALTLLLLLLLLSCSNGEQEQTYTPPTQLGEYIYFEINFKQDYYMYHSDKNCPNIERGIDFIPTNEYSSHKRSDHSFCQLCFTDELYYDLSNFK